MNGRGDSGLEQVRQRYAQAVDALNRRQWAQARAAAEPLLAQQPQHAGVHFVVGVAALEQGAIKDAFRHLLMATQLNRQRPDYAAQWARVLLECHRQPEALEQADRAMSLGPGDPMTLNTLAVIYTRGNAHERASRAFRRALEMVPDQAALHFNLATSLMAIGDIDGAIRSCEACIALRPGYWRAHLTLAQLSRQTAERNHVERLQKLLQQAPGPEAQLYLNLALEKEFDDLGEPRRALEHLIAGKKAWQPRLDRSGPSDEAIFGAIVRADQGLRRETTGHAARGPIFIIGMPRSGTTLVERIVSSHSQVHSAGELQQFPILFKKATGVSSPLMLDPPTLAAVDRIDWEALGCDYIRDTRAVAGDRPYFIDKLPQNFLYAGWIARALPESRIVCLRRDAMDTCIANFRQLFALGPPMYNYSFDLLDCGRYYLGFDRLMAHWRVAMPGRILEVNYEDVILDREATSRRLIEFCGLEWEDACLDFERNAAPVSTASAVQVRSPIYRTSMQRWKRYGDMVDGLRELLREGGVRVAS